MVHSSPQRDNNLVHENSHAQEDRSPNSVGPLTLPPPPLNLTASPLQREAAPEEELDDLEVDFQEEGITHASNGEDGSSPSDPNANNNGGLANKGPKGSSGDPGIVPTLILLGTELNLDLSDVDQSISLSINLTILPGVVAKRIEVVIEDGAFVSGTLILEANYLSGIDLVLNIAGDGTVQADISFDHEFLGFPTAVQAQVTEDGITGTIEVQIPAGHPIIAGLITTGGTLLFSFEDEEKFLRGHLEVATADGLTTGTAQVAVDLSTSDWSGSVEMVSQGRELTVAPGVNVSLPEGFQLSAEFGGDEGLVLSGAATVVPEVTLVSSEGIEAGGTAELDINLGTEGLAIELKKVRLAVTGGLNAPDIDDVLSAQHLSSEVDAGGMITLWFEDSNLSQIDLEVTGGINSESRRVGRLSFAGHARFNPFHFVGMLHAITNAEVTLIEGDRFTTSLMAGSQMFLSLDDAGISNVDASLGIEVADEESALAQLRVASSLPRGQGLSLAANLELMRRLNLTTVEENGFGVSVLPTAGLGATLVDGALTEMEGSLPVEVADQEGDLLAGSLDGKIAVSDQGVSMQDGAASATLLRNLSMELGAGEVQVLEGAAVQVRFEGGQLVSLGGQIEALFNDGNRIINISAEIDYDPTQKIIRSLDAGLQTDDVFSLFDGKLLVSEVEGGISIRNNEVVSLGGHARLDAYVGDFTLAGEADVTWSEEGEGTSFVGIGWLEFSWFEEEDADRYLNGRIDASIDGDEFSLVGRVEMGLMEGLTGNAMVAMDQEMDPEISASLTYSTQLMEASELWAMEFGMGIQIPIIPVLVTLEAGILFGMSISTRPLMVFGTVGVENWRPKSNDFPDFYAQLRASWGLDIEAKAMAYLELILGIDGLLHLTGGVRAGVGLNIPIELSPHISLHGSDEGIWGEMGIDLSIAPVLKLLIDAYMEWDVLGIWDGQKVWNLMDQELAELGNIDWSGSFAFGDKQEPTGEAEAVESQEVAPVGSPVTAPEGLNGDSSLGFGNQEQEPGSGAGLTGLTDGLVAPSAESQEGEMEQEGLGSQFQKVGEYADGIAAVGDLVGVIADGFKALVKGGPIGLIVWVLFEKPSKAEIQEKKARVSEFRSGLNDDGLIQPGSMIDLMLGILGGDYSFWIIFDKSKPYRDMVDRGMHEDATLEDRAKILEGMIKGWTGEKDESRIIEVLEYTLANEGGAGVRELTEYVGGEGRIRDQYEWFDFNDRDDLDHIFGIAYGNSSTAPEDRPIYTAKEGATVKRTGRSWEELAVEAYGHESYAVYLLNWPYNEGQISQEQAYQDHQNNNNNNNSGGGPPNPLDDYENGQFDPGNQNTNTGPPFPGYLAYIPTMAEIVGLHEQEVWQERFPVPGVLEHAHSFEDFEMIAQFAYGDVRLDDKLKVHNPDVREIQEGSRVILPSPADLGPPWIEVAPMSVGSTGIQVWVGPDGNQEPEMWMGTPDRLVSELAQEAMEFEEGKDAAEQLMQAATFTNDSTQVEAENAVKVAAGLIDFIIASGFGSTPQELAWEDAQLGDTIKIDAQQIELAAKAIYGHPERAAWIIAYNEEIGTGTHQAARAVEGGGKTGMPLQTLGFTSHNDGSGRTSFKLPTWSEMAALDPLPAAVRGVAPRSTVEVTEGDTWAKLALKAYGDWDDAGSLAEYAANAGVTLDPGSIVTLPIRSELNPIIVAEMESAVAIGPVNDGTGNTGTGTGSITPPKGSIHNGGENSQSDSITDNRNFSPGSHLTIREGDTWSAIAVATYGDFSLFVRLSNHPQNVSFKTLPIGSEIYLPTLDELMHVPEFGLGLSPNGFPLLTEMVRVPTTDGLHHIWVEDRAPDEDWAKGVWMMASTPTELEPESGEWVEKTVEDTDVHPHAKKINEAAKKGEESMEEIEELPASVRKVVDADYFQENQEFQAGEETIPKGGTDIGAVGIVNWDGEPKVRLRSSASTSADNQIGSLDFNTTLYVVKSFPGDWYFVTTEDGQMGYVFSSYVWMNLPEPNAKLHKVEGGVSGTAIAIAEKYYGEYSDDWGQDLRFYVNVLAMMNGVTVPDTSDGWEQVSFDEGSLIWVPSQPFAYGLKGIVNSGSWTYETMDAVGMAEFVENMAQRMEDMAAAIKASAEYMGSAIQRHVEEALANVLISLALMLLAAVAILAISTAIGAALGALAGGVGAAPGSAAGFEVGMVILEWLGLGMLITWVGQALWETGAAFASFFGTVWDANGDEEKIDQAAWEFAEAVGILIGNLLEAVVMYAANVGLSKGLSALKKSRIGKTMGEGKAGEWLGERVRKVSSGEAPLRRPMDVYNRIVRGVEIVNSNGAPTGEFDGVDMRNSIFIENKSASGLNRVNPRTGKPQQTPAQWAQKQITKKSRTRINNLASATATRAANGQTYEVPGLAEIQGFRHIKFKMDANSPALRAAVHAEIAVLKGEFPGWTFSAEFGFGVIAPPVPNDGPQGENPDIGNGSN